MQRAFRERSSNFFVEADSIGFECILLFVIDCICLKSLRFVVSNLKGARVQNYSKLILFEYRIRLGKINYRSFARGMVADTPLKPCALALWRSSSEQPGPLPCSGSVRWRRRWGLPKTIFFIHCLLIHPHLQFPIFKIISIAC